jgi:hypothetical protein
LAFPSLDNLGQQLIPIYDLEDSVTIDKEKFVDSFEFVMDTLAQRKGITISFIIISSFFYLFGIIALVFVIVKRKREPVPQDYSELEN